MQQQWERQPDNPAENRITTWSAVNWSGGTVFAGFSAFWLVLALLHPDKPAAMLWVLLLTLILSVLWLNIYWPLRPRRSWAVGRQILWASVFMVAAAIIVSSVVPWYVHWLNHFSR